MPALITFVHAGGVIDTPANTRRGERVGEWESDFVPIVGDVVELADLQTWRVRNRVLRHSHRPGERHLSATLYVVPVVGGGT